MTDVEGARAGIAHRLGDRIRSEMKGIRRRHERGASGLATCRAISDLTDAVVIEAYSACRENVFGDGSARTALALVALGGYGRAQLNPFSDVDLLFLYPESLSGEERRLVEGTIPLLWDAGLRVGHSCRSVAECLDVLGKDLDTSTSLLESRMTAGNQLTYVRFREALADGLRRELRWFVEAKLRERAERLGEFGDSVLLLEPNVKESPGALRDYHQIIWLTTAVWGSSEPAYLREAGVLQRPERDALLPAVDFFLRVRNGMHFMCGAQQDQIQFRSTDAVARNLGYHQRMEEHPEDALMHDYYAHATAVRGIADAVEGRVRRFLDRGEEGLWTEVPLGEGFVVLGGELAAEPCSADFFAADPGRLFTAFSLCREHGLPLHPLLREVIGGSLHLIDEGFRSSRERRDQFLSLLGAERAALVIRLLHETGVLVRYMPELGGMHRLAIDDLYHRFTVDGHTLLCLEMLDRLRSGEIRWGNSETRKLGSDLLDALRQVERMDLLRLGLLFHDAGKGHGSRHSERGAALIDAVVRRWELPEADRALAVFLVEKHLALTDVAYRRDPEDPKIIRSLAEEVGDLGRLRMLLALTLADVMGVTPGLLSEWKIVLLWRLHHRLVDVLQGRMEAAAAGKVERAALIRRLSARFGEETVRRHLELLPPHYLAYAAEDQLEAHLGLLAAYDGTAAQVAMRTLALADSSEKGIGPRTCVEVHLCTQDRLGLFRDIVHACERENLEVNSARIFTRKDGVVLDTVVAVNRLPEAELDAERMDLLRKRLLRDLDPQRRVRRRSSPLSVRDPLAAVPVQRRAARIRSQSHVKASGEITGGFTVIEFHHQDEPMLLAHVAEFLTDHDLDIQYARIYHEGRRIVGAFHVTDADGREITDQERLDRIERELREALEAHQAFQETSENGIG